MFKYIIKLYTLCKPFSNETLAQWHELRALSYRLDYKDKEAVKHFLNKHKKFRERCKREKSF